MQYNFKEIEEKWSTYWLNNKVYKKMNDKFRPRFFCLMSLTNPNYKESHINDYLNYIKGDVLSRIKRMQGYNVLFSPGFQTFGLDGEKYAIKTCNSPFDYSKKNVIKEIDILKKLGLSFDYDLSLYTSDPEIYKWSQWLFSKLYEKNLAKVKDTDIYFCDALKRVVGKNEVTMQNGLLKTIKDNFSVSIRTVKQWYIDLTDYNNKLLKNIDKLDYPTDIITDIKNIIGKKEGYNVKLRIDGTNMFFNSFLDRVDNLFGATFCLISPSSKYVLDLTSEDGYNDVLEYLKENREKEISGIFTGSFAINPVNGKLLPIWVSNYFVDEYDNEFKICVPSTDEFDFEFAANYGLDIIPIIDFEEVPYSGNGIHINSDFATDLYNDEANEKVLNFLVENGYGEKATNYKLKEICISDSIYFGEAIPVIYFNDGTVKVLNSTELPLKHPDIVVKPSGNEYSPLYNAKSWNKVFTNDGKEGSRELSTMNSYMSNSWYYLAYILKSTAGLLPINSPDAKYEFDKWMPADIYLGKFGALDLYYQRFMIHVLNDLDYININEPFKRVVELNESIDLESNIDLNNILANYGADVTRLFILDNKGSLNPIDLDIYRRYVGRIVRLFDNELNNNIPNLTDFINDVNNAYLEFDYKQAIYLIGEKINELLKSKSISKKEAVTILKLIYPICPYVSEELYITYISKKNILSFEEWPILDK